MKHNYSVFNTFTGAFSRQSSLRLILFLVILTFLPFVGNTAWADTTTSIVFNAANKNDAGDAFANMKKNDVQYIGGGIAKLIATNTNSLDTNNNKTGYRADRSIIIFKMISSFDLVVKHNANSTGARYMELSKFSSTKALADITTSDYATKTAINVTKAEGTTAWGNGEAATISVTNSTYSYKVKGQANITYTGLEAGYYVLIGAGSEAYLYGLDITAAAAATPAITAFTIDGKTATISGTTITIADKLSNGTDITSANLTLANANADKTTWAADKKSVTVSDGTQSTTYTLVYTIDCKAVTPTLTYSVNPLEIGVIATASLTNTDGHTGTVAYVSLNESVVAVNASTGEIEALAPGTATITATIAADGDFCEAIATCDVKVNAPAGMQNVTIAGYTDGTVTVAYGAESFTSGSQLIAKDTELTITAAPNGGFVLASLKLNGADFTSGNTYTIQDGEDITITAIFQSLNPCSILGTLDDTVTGFPGQNGSSGIFKWNTNSDGQLNSNGRYITISPTDGFKAGDLIYITIKSAPSCGKLFFIPGAYNESYSGAVKDKDYLEKAASAAGSYTVEITEELIAAHGTGGSLASLTIQRPVTIAGVKYESDHKPTITSISVEHCIEYVACTPPTASMVDTSDKELIANTGSTSFTVNATAQNGFGDLTYQWYKSTDKVADASDTKIAGATSATFTPTPEAEDAVGFYYYCVVKEKYCSQATTVFSGKITVGPYVGCETSTVTNIVKETATVTGEFVFDGKTNSDGKLSSSNNYITISLKDGKTFKAGDEIEVELKVSGDGNLLYLVKGTQRDDDIYPEDEILMITRTMDGGTYTFILPASFDGATAITFPREVNDNTKHNPTFTSISMTRCVGCSPEPTITSDMVDNKAVADDVITFTVSAIESYETAEAVVTKTGGSTYPALTRSGNTYTFTPTEDGEYTIKYAVQGKGTCYQYVEMVFQVTPNPCVTLPPFTASLQKTLVEENEIRLPLVLGTFEYYAGTKPILTSNIETVIPGCQLNLSDDREILLTGTPDYPTDLTAAETEKRITFTISTGCGEPALSETYTVKVTIYKKGTYRLAYIVEDAGDTDVDGDGKTNGFRDYNQSQADGTALFDYLREVEGPDGTPLFTVEATNCYATTDEAAILDFYSDYDVIILTDYPKSGNKDGSGKSYSNAIGSLIDKKPVLSFETYVANLPNWKLGTSALPEDPEYDEVENLQMTLLCEAMEIFKDVTEPLDKPLKIMSALGSDEGEEKGLQGFNPVSAPDYMFIATIKDGENGTLITCCERQVVMTARTILFGLNWSGMKNINTTGKTIVKNMIEYLLITNEDLLADCSMTFDNGQRAIDAGISEDGSGDSMWSNKKNWLPGRNSLPGPYHVVRIEQPCKVDITDAHASMIDIKDGSATIESVNHNFAGQLTILPEGGLTVTGLIRKVHGNKFVTKEPIKYEDLIIQSNDTGQGALAQGDKEGNTPATIEYYSRAYDADTENPVWQYIGIPFSTKTIAIENFKYSWMCRWKENVPSEELGFNWEWVRNEDQLFPFNGYCITQPEKKTYSLKGNLVESTRQTIPLTRTDFTGNDQAGVNMLANSWMAPIDISKLKAEDFSGVEATIYIYNSGTYANWTSNGATSGYTTFVPGQFMTLPIGTAATLDVPTIPPMQAFYVFVNSGTSGTLTLDYDRLMYNTDHSQTTRPLHKPSMNGPQQEPERTVMWINVFGEDGMADNVAIVTDEKFTSAFDNGLDGSKAGTIEGMPYITVQAEDKDLAVAAIPTFEGTRISFCRGSSMQNTLGFEYDGTKPLYLRDIVTNQEVEIRTGETYTFLATDSVLMERFEIIDKQEKPGVATSLSDVCVHDGMLYLTNPAAEQVDVAVFSADGKLLQQIKTHDRAVPIAVPTNGVYLIQLTTEQGVRVVKQIL